jgi:4'-phosphopantetheinyl transferase
MPLAYIKYQGPHSILGLWHLTEDESFFRPSINKLVTDERNLESIHHAKRRTEWLAGRYLVMELAKHVNLSFDGIWTDQFNKPHLILENAHISLSHTPPYVVAILDERSLCGIDVESFRPKLIPLSTKFLNQSELDFAGQNLETLAVLWGAKEALYKLHGRKSLIFKDNLIIKDFEYEDGRGNFRGIIDLNDEHEEYHMLSWKFGDYVLVYTAGEIYPDA